MLITRFIKIKFRGECSEAIFHIFNDQKNQKEKMLSLFHIHDNNKILTESRAHTDRFIQF